MTRQSYDIVVIGGGVTGVGTALDAAARGLSVALVEQRDYAAGTSSRSSKLLHGGLRYLEQLRFGLVAQALRERNLMVGRLCPHLTVPVRFLYPLRQRLWDRVYVGAGVLLYDLLAWLGRSPLPGHRHLTRTGVRRVAPGLETTSVVGAVEFSDVVVDDARHTMTLARTAAQAGARLATSVRAVGLTERIDRISGVEAHDLESGRHFTIEAGVVVNTTGVWTDEVEGWAGDTEGNVQVSKGIHLVVPRHAIDMSRGLITRTERSVLFVIPWGDFWIVGTTETHWDLHLAHPAASRTDIEYLLDRVNSVLATPLTDADIIGVYAGLRPLLRGESESTSKLSREHAVRQVRPGLITVAGGKYTTYRVMASDVVDAAVTELGVDRPPCSTDQIRLVGAVEITGDRLSRLGRRYGANAADIGELIAGAPGLGETVAGAAPYLKAEIVYAVTHEGALHLDDVLTRRTRISIETDHRGTESAEEVARLMAPMLGWDEATIAREVDHYLARVEAERDSQTKPDDTTADAARMGAPDVRMGAGR